MMRDGLALTVPTVSPEMHTCKAIEKVVETGFRFVPLLGKPVQYQFAILSVTTQSQRVVGLDFKKI